MPWPWKDMERVCSRWRECGVKCYDECDTSRISVDHGRTGTTQPPPSRRPGSLPAIDLRIHPCSWFRTLRLRRLGIQSHSSTGTKPGACVSRGGLVTAPPASMTSFRAHLPPVCCSAVQAAAPVLLPVRMTVPVTVLVALTDPVSPVSRITSHAHSFRTQSAQITRCMTCRLLLRLCSLLHLNARFHVVLRNEASTSSYTRQRGNTHPLLTYSSGTVTICSRDGRSASQWPEAIFHPPAAKQHRGCMHPSAPGGPTAY